MIETLTAETSISAPSYVVLIGSMAMRRQEFTFSFFTIISATQPAGGFAVGESQRKPLWAYNSSSPASMPI